MDVRSTFAAETYARAKPATAPEGGGIGDSLGRAVQSFTETLSRGEDVARAAMVGGADPHALVQALASSQLAVETVATVRDKVVEAYQEILRMPV
jgi:flagellar hook-basal body complex protein FliE